jgi:hypothetical protein
MSSSGYTENALTLEKTQSRKMQKARGSFICRGVDMRPRGEEEMAIELDRIAIER